MNATQSNTANFMPTDEWIERVQDEIEAMPQTLIDAGASPEWVGKVDAHIGYACDPLQHYIKLGDIEQYIIGWKDATAAIEAHQARIAAQLYTEAEIVVMAEDYEDDMTDRIFFGWGC